ncbi:hypothetical protein [Corynebacterium pelargi]|uniref:Low molecular weight protein-tyrosine-phosphatase etp n=1 Tax=Corynebacterium pelargi TaxID=1471400 RepID=A0A410W679_9CORY|nr:hypothetical protein [Corynebacterium pelargi]QAU51384.1 Low molecular weight protein-tyrosine-phosphatase etp [Corynebacterium pelargi]GGG81295.1 hypothetical protein GCM10007338_19980 [Corynebacterium pelargi]
MTFSILTVCTGNVCRSPYIQYRLAGEAFSRGIDVEVRSAGTHAVNGNPYHEFTLDQLQLRGIDARAGRSSHLGVQQLRSAQLILVASRSHITHIARLYAPSLRHTLTLKQAAYLGSKDPVGAYTGGIQQQLPPGFESDLADPIGQPAEAFASMANDVDALMPSVFRFLSAQLPSAT